MEKEDKFRGFISARYLPCLRSECSEFYEKFLGQRISINFARYLKWHSMDVQYEV